MRSRSIKPICQKERAMKSMDPGKVAGLDQRPGLIVADVNLHDGWCEIDSIDSFGFRHFWFVAVCLVSQLALAQAAWADDESVVRPWESRPYRVQVWLCGDRSPEISAVVPSIKNSIAAQASLADPSGWRVEVSDAPAPIRYQLADPLSDIDEFGLSNSDMLDGTDKLTVVVLSKNQGNYRYRVQEFDVQTGQWGAVIERQCAQTRDLAGGIFDSIVRVFMPLARIERIVGDDEVFVRVRAINACQQSDIIDGSVTAIENSPVWVRPNDKFLPIIRRIDRNGELSELNPIPFTFLTINNMEGVRMRCQIHSRQRAVLAGRSSKRAQKLALVIRPPESSSELKLVSRSDESRPLSGFEIYSRNVDADQQDASEFLGLTDWRGIIEIPPDPSGLRLIYVKRGNRPLVKLPIIPGLYERVSTIVPDDESRLKAAGIVSGFEIEILNLVAQRQLLKTQIQSRVSRGDLNEAREFLKQLQKLESPQDLKLRLADEESRLRNETANESEIKRITSMFQTLQRLVNSNVAGNLDVEMQGLIQRAQAGVAAGG